MSTAEYQNAYNANMMSSGWLGDGPMEFAAAYGGKWLVTAYEAGDVVLHKPHMVCIRCLRVKHCKLTSLRFMLRR